MTIVADTLQRTANEKTRSRPVILNLGCGTKTSELCINVDFSMYMILRQNTWALPLVRPIIGSDRVERIKAMRGTMVRQISRTEFRSRAGLPTRSTIRM